MLAVFFYIRGGRSRICLSDVKAYMWLGAVICRIFPTLFLPNIAIIWLIIPITPLTYLPSVPCNQASDGCQFYSVDLGFRDILFKLVPSQSLPAVSRASKSCSEKAAFRGRHLERIDQTSSGFFMTRTPQRPVIYSRSSSPASRMAHFLQAG